MRNPPALARRTIGRVEVIALVNRLRARAEWRVVSATPEVRDDLRTAAILLTRALMTSFPRRPIEIDTASMPSGK